MTKARCECVRVVWSGESSQRDRQKLFLSVWVVLAVEVHSDIGKSSFCQCGSFGAVKVHSEIGFLSKLFLTVWVVLAVEVHSDIGKSSFCQCGSF